MNDEPITILALGPENLLKIEKTEELFRCIFDAAADGLILTDLATGLVVEANTAACVMHGYETAEFIGLHPTTFIQRDSYVQYVQAKEIVQDGGEFEGTIVHIQRDGLPFTVEVNVTGCMHEQRLHLLSTIHPIGTRDAMGQLLRQQVMARMREQTTLLEISQVLSSELDIKPEMILDQLRIIIEYDRAALFTLEGWDLVVLAVRGSDQLAETAPYRVRLASTVAQATLMTGHQSQRIGEVWGDEPEAEFLRTLLHDEAILMIEGMRSWMWVPLVVKGRIIGGLAVTHAEPNYFTAHHANLVQTVANQAAIALVNAELHEQVQTHAALEERQRLSQNLHDAVNQSLFSASIIAEVLPRLWQQRPDEVWESLQDLRRLTRGALAEMRALLVELRPLVLNDSDLEDLLHLLGDALTGRTNIPVSVTVTDNRVQSQTDSSEAELARPTIPANVQTVLYRLCQEALNNIARHSGASHVAIELHYGPEAVAMSIRDDGQGFDPETTPTDHYGLRMMHERAEAVGAMLTINSRPGTGTEISVHWASILE